jgi:hypothetical protein
MIRARFKVNGADYRPVMWPIPHPYWCSGYSADGKAIIVAYAAGEPQILRLWPDAEDIDVMETELTQYTFTERFQRPEWFAQADIQPPV